MAANKVPEQTNIPVHWDSARSELSRILSLHAREINSRDGSLFVTPQKFGAKGDGVTDDTAAIQAADSAAAGGQLWFPEGVYKATGALTQSDETEWAGTYSSVIDKRFNGDLLTLGRKSVLRGLRIEGNGATYTGRGVLITSQAASGGDLTHWAHIVSAHILDMGDVCVEYTQNRAGYGSHIIGTWMSMAGANRYTAGCVKLPTGETNNGNRRMIGCFTFGHRMFDAGECDNFEVVGCEGAIPIMGASSQKIAMSACKIVNTADGLITNWSINGISHAIQGNVIHCSSITFESGLAQLQFANALASGITITDNATGQGSGNEIDLRTQTYTPAWTASVAPAIGNGTLNGAYVRQGDQCRVNIRLEAGSSTTFGTGAWSFSLPYTAARNAVGSVYIEDATGPTIYVGTAWVVSGASTLRVATAASTSAYAGSAVPMTWASGDKMQIEIEFPIT